MTARIINGKSIANSIKDEIAAAVSERINAGLPIPGLATVLVGNDLPSQTYVRNKIKTCEKLGIHSFSHVLPKKRPGYAGKTGPRLKRQPTGPWDSGSASPACSPGYLSDTLSYRSSKRRRWNSSGKCRVAIQERKQPMVYSMYNSRNFTPHPHGYS